MKHTIRNTMLCAGLMSAISAHAGIIDFIDLTESSYGEGAWDPLGLSVDGVNVTIAGYKTGGDAAYAYLDWGNAGLGVCKTLATGATPNTISAGRTSNSCSLDTDDNVTDGEYLRFIFDHDVVVDNIWFNNNHDGGFGAGDKVSIGGSQYNVATGYAGGINGLGAFVLSAGAALDVAYDNEQFYVSAIEVNRVSVPEPGTLALFGLGLAGMALAYRRRAEGR